MTITAVVAEAVAIWGSVLGYKVMCCGAPTAVVPVRRPSLRLRIRILYEF